MTGFLNPGLMLRFVSEGVDARARLVAEDVWRDRRVPLVDGDLWLFDALGTFEEGVPWRETLCSHGGGVPSTAQVAQTLERLADVVFLDEASSPRDARDALDMWRSRGWKLALDVHLRAQHEPAPAPLPGRATSEVPALPSRARTDRDALGVYDVRSRAHARAKALLRARRTCRAFGHETMPLATLATLLARVRAAPPPPWLGMFVVALRVDGLSASVYAVDRARVELVAIEPATDTATLERGLVELLIGQPYVEGTAIAIVLTVDLRVLDAVEAPSRALSRCAIEVGMFAQRVILEGLGLDYASFLSGAIKETVARRFLGASCGPDLLPLHVVALGKAQTP